jgi:hypothetical protein
MRKQDLADRLADTHQIINLWERYVGYRYRVTLTCSCGKKARSARGRDGAYASFDKHVKRQVEKATRR